MGRLGIAVAVIVWLFYMSMIYGSAAMALAGFALIFFMIFSYVELLWLWKNSSARLEIPLAMASQKEKCVVCWKCEIHFPGKRRKNGFWEMQRIRMS